MIRQGDLCWVDTGTPIGSAPGYIHPHVVIQNNLFNRSQIETIIICPLTSNLTLAKSPGNVLLGRKETGLPKPSVVNVSQVLTVDRSELGEWIGTLPQHKVREVLYGVKLMIEPKDTE